MGGRRWLLLPHSKMTRKLLFRYKVLAQFADGAFSDGEQHGGIAGKLIGGHLSFKLIQVDSQTLMGVAKCLELRRPSLGLMRRC